MLLAYLGLQVAAPAGLGRIEEILLVAVQRRRRRGVRAIAGEVAQVRVDGRVQRRLVGEAQGVDVHQRTLFPLAAGLQVFPGVAAGFQRVVHARSEQALAAAQDEAEAAGGGDFRKTHAIPCDGNGVTETIRAPLGSARKLRSMDHQPRSRRPG
ncbi:hypothetical protein D3C78_1182240 [compost metagenome]